MPIVPHYDWRGLQVVIAHPRDHHGELLFRYLQHLGCIVEVSWPPSVPSTPSIDFLFCAVDEKARRLLEIYSSRTTTAVVGVSILALGLCVSLYDLVFLWVISRLMGHS